MRVTRMLPAEATLASPRQSITSTRAGRNGFHRRALRMGAVGEHVERVDVLARRNVAQRVGRADHRRRIRIERARALHEGIAQAALEQLRGQRRGAHGRELRARGFAQWFGHARSPAAFCRTARLTFWRRALIERRPTARKPRRQRRKRMRAMMRCAWRGGLGGAGGACARAGMAGQAGQLHRAVLGRRHHRPVRAAARPAHAAEVRPAVHRGEPRGRGRQSRRRRGREGRARRLHLPGRHGVDPRDQPVPLFQAALRHREGFPAGQPDRAAAEHPGGASEPAGEQRRRS